MRPVHPPHFNPRPPHRGRHFHQCPRPQKAQISTHAPRTGGDGIGPDTYKGRYQFQPTPPAQGATKPCKAGFRRFGISTHAPRTGGDFLPPERRWAESHFNPRPPHRGRLKKSRWTMPLSVFQPTPPAQGATIPWPYNPAAYSISTHAPRTGGDGWKFRKISRNFYFNPRPPHRGRHILQVIFFWAVIFQPTPPAQGATGLAFRTVFCPLISTHAPRTGGDLMLAPWMQLTAISTHAPRTGGDGHFQSCVCVGLPFQPTPPAQGATSRCHACPRGCSHFNPRPPHRGRPEEAFKYVGA